MRAAGLAAAAMPRILSAVAVLLLALTVPVQARAADEAIEIPTLASARAAGAPPNLQAALFRPSGPGPFPALVALHGCGGLRLRSGALDARAADWGARLAAIGYVVVFPDSFATRGVREICTQANRVVSPTRGRPEDAFAARAWLAQQPFVDAGRIGVVGWSNGASTVLTVIDASRPLPPDSGGAFQTAIAFYPGCRTALRSGRWSARGPLAIFMGDADNWTAPAPCVDLVAAAEQRGEAVAITLYPGAHHDFDHPNLPLRERRGLAFTVSQAGTATLGTDPAGRADVLQRVPTFLAATLGR